MEKKQCLIPAEFLGTSLSVIDHDGQRWLTAEQVGLALGFAESNAKRGILKLYRHHAAEFNDTDKGVVVLATPGGEQEVIVFSASGCILLSFFAQTKRAAAFRAWAKKTLAAPEVQAAAPAPDASLLSRLQAEVLKAKPKWAAALRYVQMGLTRREMAMLLSYSGKDSVRRLLRQIEACGFDVAPLPAPAQLPLAL